jgi:hypothetical protein
MGGRAALSALEHANYPTHGTGYTPFFMVHGSEAVLPSDIDYGSPRVRVYTDEGNQVSLEDAIEQLDVARDVALLLGPVSTGDSALPWSHRSGESFPSRGSGATPGPEQQRSPQAITAMGRPLHRRPSPITNA